MSKEVLKMALEALENSVDLVREDAYQALKLYGNYPTRQGKVNGLKVLADDHEKAITALREALANEALGKMAENAKELGLDYEPAQKPQRWAVFCQGCRKEWSVSYPHPGKDICVDCDDKPAQQKPVAYQDTADKCRLETVPAKGGLLPQRTDEEEYLSKAYRLANELRCHLAIAPAPQRTWVGLTDEEIWETISRIGTSDSDVNPYAKLADARAIEAKLKEKNT